MNAAVLPLRSWAGLCHRYGVPDLGRSLRIIVRFIMAILVCLSAASCQKRQNLLPTTEFVLAEGMIITATNPNGRVTISAGQGTERTFSGDGWSKRRNLIPRQERWRGSLGLYDPGDSFSLHGRLLAEEGRLFFKSESEALRYLSVEGGSYKPVFNNRGLVVGYNIVNIPGGKPTRMVDVWQIYINGQRPMSLQGANDSAVTIKGGSILDTAKPNPASVGYEQVLGEKEYRPE
jgi:hypothetical protein